jgi:DNA-binding transcriptional MocR family regulator
MQQLDAPDRAARLAHLVHYYRDRRDAFSAALVRTLGDLATWSTPMGGLFFWLTLRHARNTRALLAPAIERGVAFMPGEPFYPDARPAAGALRLNFSHASLRTPSADSRSSPICCATPRFRSRFSAIARSQWRGRRNDGSP